MSIASEITRINTNIANSYTAVDNKGGTLPATQNSANLASAIDSIEVIESATAEGESLNLTNTKAMPYKDYVLKGKSEQATRSGKNLVNISGTTSSGTTVVTLGTFTTYENGKIYTLSSKLNMGSSSKSGRIRLQITYSDDTPTSYIGDWVSGTGVLISKATFTASSNISTVSIQFQPNNEGIEVYDIQLEQGSTPTSYEPYGASPSPDYPSEIHSVADDVNLLNLQDIENHNINNYYESITTDFQLEAGQTYTLSFDAESTVTPFNVGIGCGSSGNYQSDILKENGFQNGRISITFTPQNSNFTYGNYLALRFVRYNSSTSYTYSARNIKLQKGTEATPYSPYNQGTVTIKQRGTTESNDYTIQTSPLRSLPNGVKDTIEAEQHRKIGRQTGTLTETTTITLSDAKTNGAYMCNIKPSGTLTGKTIELEAGDYEIIYELEEEIIEPLTQNQATTMLDIIKTGSYEGTTNIYTDEDVKPTIGVGYYKKG